MKKIIILLVFFGLLFSPFAKADVQPSQEDLKAQIIALLTEEIKLLKAELAQMMAQNATYTISSPSIVQNIALPVPTITPQCVTPEVVISQGSSLVATNQDKQLYWSINITSSGQSFIPLSHLTLTMDSNSNENGDVSFNTENPFVNGKADFTISSGYMKNNYPNSSSINIPFQISLYNPVPGDKIRFGIELPDGIVINDPCNPDSKIDISSNDIWSNYITVNQ